MSTIKRVLLTSVVALLFTVLSATIVLAATQQLSDQISGDFKVTKSKAPSPMNSGACTGCAGGKAHWVNKSREPSTVAGKWIAHHNNTTTWWYVYIPNNGAANGGTYYIVQNSVHSFTIPLIQANHHGQWVSLGFLDVGDNAIIKADNLCTPLAYCDSFLYWDDAKYDH
ncbi:MAG: hypothetical protein Fur0022_33450 [Anaerolineales bacterium]